MKSITETKVRFDRKDHYVYQDINGEVLWAPTNFIIEFSGHTKTKNKYRKALRRLFKYVNTRDNPMTWLNINDYHIEKFRDWSFEETKSDPRYRGDDILAKQTTNNDYLMPIYAFYYWVQKQGEYHTNILGFDAENPNAFQITSSQLQRDIAISKDEKPNKDWLYPMLFKNCDSKGKRGSSASEYELEELKGYIISNYDGFERASLLLIVQIVNDTGGRPISIASLTRHQFDKDIVERESIKDKKAVFEVVPKRAKFGNTMPLRFPISTTMSVMSFIKNDLEPFINTHQVKGYDGHIFLSANNKAPLSESDIIKTFSKITTELGWPKGKSIYSLRHKFSEESFDKHLAVAIELGFSANEASICLQMQRDMTHRSSGSIASYVESRMRMGQKTEANKKELKIKSLESDKTRLALEAQKAFEIADMKATQNQDLMAEVEQLKSELALLKKHK